MKGSLVNILVRSCDEVREFSLRLDEACVFIKVDGIILGYCIQQPLNWQLATSQKLDPIPKHYIALIRIRQDPQ